MYRPCLSIVIFTKYVHCEIKYQTPDRFGVSLRGTYFRKMLIVIPYVLQEEKLKETFPGGPLRVSP